MLEIGIGLVGAGFFGRHHAHALASVPGARLVAVCDEDQGRAEEIAALVGASAYRSVDDLAADHRVDAVHVVTPEDRHLETVLPALTAGKHVLCEKPLSLRLTEIDQMEAAARKAGVLLMPGHILRFDHRYLHVRELVATSTLGEVAFASFRRFGNREIFPAVWQNAPGPFVASIHDIDLALWYVDSEPVEVWGAHTSFVDADIPDSYAFSVRFRSGALATFETSCLPPPGSPFVSAAMTIYGTNGMAEVRHPSDALFVATAEQRIDADVFSWPSDQLGSTGALAREVAYFAECVRDGRTSSVAVTPGDARRAVEVAAAAVEAATAGHRIDLAT
jgi:UDP-N-acetylglucosamine 3-dehydrogenase